MHVTSKEASYLIYLCVYLFIYFIYLFVLGLFNDAFNFLDYTVSNDRMPVVVSRRSEAKAGEIVDSNPA
jgi:hypothetical protein